MPKISRQSVISGQFQDSFEISGISGRLWPLQRWTCWTHVVTINLFSLYLMNFMLHIMLDATGVVLRVHYKVWNVMFYFHKVTYVQCLGEVDIFSYMSKKISSSLQQCKNYKNRWRFSKVVINNVLPPFLWFTV